MCWLRSWYVLGKRATSRGCSFWNTRDGHLTKIATRPIRDTLDAVERKQPAKTTRAVKFAKLCRNVEIEGTTAVANDVGLNLRPKKNNSRAAKLRSKSRFSKGITF